MLQMLELLHILSTNPREHDLSLERQYFVGNNFQGDLYERDLSF